MCHPSETDMSTGIVSQPPAAVWKIPRVQWALVVLAGAAIVGAFLPAVNLLFETWGTVEEYSYGYFIPLISAFLIWQRADQLRQRDLRGSWSGVLLVLFALVLNAVGSLSAMLHFSQYGLVVALFGLSVCLIGWRGTRIVAVPLGTLLFMIPLPNFVMNELSQQLQLVSSQLGVWLIRLFGISVFLEGNVIDLGSYKLQVVEACNGLRYLFPLMVLGFLSAYFFQGAWWKRAVIVLSTIPLTIGINSLRIGMIGITVEYWGPSMAEGLLHDFEGWFMFMLCVALMVAGMSILARVGGRPQSLRAVFGLEFPEPIASGTPIRWRSNSLPTLTAMALLASAATVTLATSKREQIRPDRTSFDQLPMTLPGGWSGRPDHLDSDVLTTLALDDYVLTNYSVAGEPWVNFYSAYYAMQSTGRSTHSPRNCMPGGGWRITELKETSVTPIGNAAASMASVTVNRAIIQRGDQRQLVYYWFDQRGRSLTDELKVKWFILQDSITRNRSDGALIRLVTPVTPSEDLAQADRRLSRFLGSIAPRLPVHIPN